MSKSDNTRQSFILTFVVAGLAIVISLLHIAYTKGRSWFLIPYIVVFLAIVVAVVAIVWPHSVAALDSGVQSDAGIFVQDSGHAFIFQAEDNAFAPYPDESIDAGLCEVPK